MDKKLRETTILGEEIMNSKQQVKRKLGLMVQIRVLPFYIIGCLTSLLLAR